MENKPEIRITRIRTRRVNDPLITKDGVAYDTMVQVLVEADGLKPTWHNYAGCYPRAKAVAMVRNRLATKLEAMDFYLRCPEYLLNPIIGY